MMALSSYVRGESYAHARTMSRDRGRVNRASVPGGQVAPVVPKMRVESGVRAGRGAGSALPAAGSVSTMQAWKGFDGPSTTSAGAGEREPARPPDRLRRSHANLAERRVRGGP